MIASYLLADLPLGWRIYAIVTLGAAFVVIALALLANLAGTVRHAMAIARTWLPRRPRLYVVKARQHNDRRAHNDDVQRRRHLESLEAFQKFQREAEAQRPLLNSIVIGRFDRQVH